jgi:hypothetical protein
MSRAYATLLAETVAVSSLLTGEQPLERLKGQSCLITHGLHAIVNYFLNSHAQYFSKL